MARPRRDISNLFRLSGGDYERFGCKFIISGNAGRITKAVGKLVEFQSTSSSAEGAGLDLGRPPQKLAEPRTHHFTLHSEAQGASAWRWGEGGVGFFFSSSFVFCALLSPPRREDAEKSLFVYCGRSVTGSCLPARAPVPAQRDWGAALPSAGRARRHISVFGGLSRALAPSILEI
ncbi:hypothetical protein QTO34_013834 [Cnephaeus nilssonii]|uniref:Uncharacterized protein n=1 Tax=Cnephaeus nilssonii TaxID=3371016 RepID=A0AA40I9K1_CNENI|nr:hypothetical protein QTO34_013834 [Eptesicus nilssonii]